LAKTLKIAVDNTAPITSLNPSGNYYIPHFGDNAGDLYAPLNFFYKLSAYDPTVNNVSSGLLLSEYRIIELEYFGTKPLEPAPSQLNGKFVPFNYENQFSSFTLNEGISRVDYRSRDNVLNLELTKTATIYTDATAPISNVVFLGTYAVRSDGIIINSSSPLTIAAEDPLVKGVASGVKASYFIEDANEILTKEYEPPSGGGARIIAYHVPRTKPDGYINLAGFSVDNVGNNEPAFTREVVLDNTPPRVFIISPSTSVSNTGVCKLVYGTSVKIIGTITDKGEHTGGVEFDHFSSYTLEYGWGSEPLSYQVITTSAPEKSLTEQVLGIWDTTGLAEGIYTLRARARDCLGNESAASVQVIVSEPQLVLSLGSRGKGKGEFNNPSYIAIDSRNGDFWVSDTNNDRLQKFDSSGTYILEISEWETGGKGKNKANSRSRAPKTDTFNKPTGLAVDLEGNLWACDRNNDRVLKFSSTGGYISALEADLNKPHGISTDKENNLWVADRNNDQIKKFSSEGELILTIDTGIGADLNKPQGAIAIDELNRVYVTDRNTGRVLIYDSSGTFIRQLGGDCPGSETGCFNKPDGIAASALAYAYVADSNNSRIVKFDPYGNAILTFNKARNDSETLNHPAGVAIDSEGNLFVVDANNSKVRKFAAEGELLVIASQESEEGTKSKKTKKLVSRNEGGTVRHPKGIEVRINKNSLTSDTEITIETGIPAPESKGFRHLGNLSRNMQSVAGAVEFGPEGTVFSEPVEITLPYDSQKLRGVNEKDLKVYYFNPATGLWEEMPTTLNTYLKIAKTYTTHFSIYDVMAPVIPQSDFKFGEVYVFPNPAVGSQKPTFHIEVGIADRVKIRVYTVSGRFAHEHTIRGMPQVVDDGSGAQYAYEYTWDEEIPSGIYYYCIEAWKEGQKMRKTGKFAIIR